jgi:hypothetical protein
MAETFRHVFASVAMSYQVVQALQTYRLSNDFQVGVINSDVRIFGISVVIGRNSFDAMAFSLAADGAIACFSSNFFPSA